MDKVIRIRSRLTTRLAQHQGICAIEIGTPADDIRPSFQQYVIRIFVNDPDLGIAELGIPGIYEGVPVYIDYRDPAAY